MNSWFLHFPRSDGADNDNQSSGTNVSISQPLSTKLSSAWVPFDFGMRRMSCACVCLKMGRECRANRNNERLNKSQESTNFPRKFRGQRKSEKVQQSNGGKACPDVRRPKAAIRAKLNICFPFTAGDIFYACCLRQDEAYVYVCWYEMRRISEMRAICPFTRDNAHEWSAGK